MKFSISLRIGFLIMVLAFLREGVFAASFDTSDRKIAYYRASVSRNKDVVLFIDEALQYYGLPKALHNLALIESDFNHRSVSVASAAGVWQIMPEVALEYGLQVNRRYDERYDVYKSTLAACDILANLYRQYKDWLHVIAAYNCGAARVNKAMARAHSKNYTDFYRFLPAETIMHVYKFVLACWANGDTF